MAGALQLVSFNLNAEEFGIAISLVQEIVRMPEITRVPCAPDFVEGVVNLRGKIIPVLDLRKRFGLALGETTKETRIIVVTIDGRTVGLIVDAVSEVLRLDADAIEPTPELVAAQIDASFLMGIAKLDGRLLILLDLALLLDDKETKTLAGLTLAS